MDTKESLVSRYLYESPYVKDVQKFKDDILHKRVIPHQVEVQPGPLGKNICWLECPYCYGKSAINSPGRLPLGRYMQVLQDIMAGGCKKFIFAGWATDPLYYKHIDDLVQTAVDGNAIIGFNTRALNISDRFVGLVSRSTLAKNSYMSISVNAGNNENYNKVNGVRSGAARLYDRVVENIRRIVSRKIRTGAALDISISYLVNQYTSSIEEVKKFIADFKGVGADLIRFSCPQIPRGDAPGENPFIPTQGEYNRYMEQLTNIIEDNSDDSCRIIVAKNDDIFLKARTTPCFARFVYPTIGYDGWLYHCSQSSGSNFRSQALGNLATDNFWDLLYDYDAKNLDGYFAGCAKKMEGNNCRCDRKEHTVNAGIAASGFFGS